MFWNEIIQSKVLCRILDGISKNLTWNKLSNKYNFYYLFFNSLNMECIFCRIANWEIPWDIVYEDENYLAFNDIHPQAPIHILIIPKKHIPSFVQTNQEDQDLVKWMLDIAWKIVKMYDLEWCQLHMNSGRDHGQLVDHIHLHLLAKGKTLEMRA